MPPNYAILREADCQIDLAKAAEILAPACNLAKVEMLQALHDRPGMLAWNVSQDAARDAAKALILSGMPCRVVQEDTLVTIPAAPRSTIRGMRFEDQHLVFRSAEWEGRVPWENIRLLDIVQEMESKTELVPSNLDKNYAQTTPGHQMVRHTKFEISVFLEIVCANPVLRMRIDRGQFRYKSTGLKMHTAREQNFRALCIALHMRSPAALMGPGFHWISKGNNSHHESGNTRKKFENFATWLLTVED